MEHVEVGAQGTPGQSRGSGAAQITLARRRCNERGREQPVKEADVIAAGCPRERTENRRERRANVGVIESDERNLPAPRREAGDPRNEDRASDLDHVGLFAIDDSAEGPGREEKSVLRLARDARPANSLATRFAPVEDLVAMAGDAEHVSHVVAGGNVPLLLVEVPSNTATSLAIPFGDVEYRQRS